jgi:ribosome recycling factor
MGIQDIRKQATEKMAKSVDTLKHNLSKVRTGRAHAGLIDHLRVDYYGSEMPINQVANVTLADARTIQIQPFEKKMVQPVEKAIRDSDLGVAPSNDGVVIRLNLPPLTEERRKEYVKITKHMAEDGRVAVRNVRRDTRKHLEASEKQGEISSDELDRAEKELEKITHEHVDDIDKALARKEHELLEV